jgi:gliding motility-associated lipoprotein GldD
MHSQNHYLYLVRYFIAFALIIFCAVACYDTDFQPRKRGYYYAALPKKEYTTFNTAGYPFSFSYPVYGKPVKDTQLFKNFSESPYWINIDFAELNGKLHLTYKPITSEESFVNLIKDAYHLSHVHDKKATYIKEPEFHTSNNVHGTFFEVGGNAASALQFFATDSHKHFIRGALYFNATPNSDSIAPASKFLIEDAQYFIKTLKWTK